jgi:hypothetical protein
MPPPEPCKASPVSRDIIDKRLLAALDDKNKDDLDMLINALHLLSSTGGKYATLYMDLKQLRKEAFGKD